MSESDVSMPDGKTFIFWDDRTAYKHVYHVSCDHPFASDEGPGTEDHPFATIGRAAQVLWPGDKVIVHGGIYRECVRPAHGGDSPDRMIAYEAATGEDVSVRGSERWTPTFAPSEDWDFGELPDGATVWTGSLPAEWFAAYNPFMTRNFSSEYATFTRDWTAAEIHSFMLRRGMIFENGRPLKQVFHPEELGGTAGAFWVEDPGLRIHMRPKADSDPRGLHFEITTREQVFAPFERRLGYIRVSGFTFEYAADGVPVPQRAMLSASRGHHWIIEDNEIRWANACGIDVGNETWHRRDSRHAEPSGGCHIIRRNHVSHCGICGIAAVGNNAGSLVEDNTVEHIGAKNIERIWETGGMKFHACDTVLFQRNLFRHIQHAPGLWLDYLNRNSRITRNTFADIESLNGCIYIEVSHGHNVVDHNVLWDIRAVDGRERASSGLGVNIDTGEKCIVAHNFFGKIRDNYAVSAHLFQHGRVVGGRVGLCRNHRILNNIFYDCPKRILLSRVKDNQSDGNLFDARNDVASFCIEYPEPRELLDLRAWREFYELDGSSRQGRIEAQFDMESAVVTMKAYDDMPKCVEVGELHNGEANPAPGPLVDKDEEGKFRINPALERSPSPT